MGGVCLGTCPDLGFLAEILSSQSGRGSDAPGFAPSPFVWSPSIPSLSSPFSPSDSYSSTKGRHSHATLHAPLPAHRRSLEACGPTATPFSSSNALAFPPHPLSSNNDGPVVHPLAPRPLGPLGHPCCRCWSPQWPLVLGPPPAPLWSRWEEGSCRRQRPPRRSGHPRSTASRHHGHEEAIRRLNLQGSTCCFVLCRLLFGRCFVRRPFVVRGCLLDCAGVVRCRSFLVFDRGRVDSDLVHRCRCYLLGLGRSHYHQRSSLLLSLMLGIGRATRLTLSDRVDLPFDLPSHPSAASHPPVTVLRRSCNHHRFLDHHRIAYS